MFTSLASLTSSCKIYMLIRPWMDLTKVKKSRTTFDCQSMDFNISNPTLSIVPKASEEYESPRFKFLYGILKCVLVNCKGKFLESRIIILYVKFFWLKKYIVRAILYHVQLSVAAPLVYRECEWVDVARIMLRAKI